MMHCTMEDLVALRGGEGSVWARKHVTDCADCRDQLDALHQRIAQLKALPALRPSRDRWPAVREVVVGARRARRRAVWTVGGLAAAAGLVALLTLRVVGPSVALADEIARVKDSSAALEADLRPYYEIGRPVSGREAAIVAELEDRIAVIDGALAQAAREPELLQLWQQRVGLMQQLYGVRVTRASYVGL